LTAAKTKTSLQAAYRKTFHALLQPLDNRTAAMALNGLSADHLSQARQALDHDLAELKGRSAISLAESVKLISDYNEREIYSTFGSSTAVLIAEDDAHRYAVQKDVIVAMPDGTSYLDLPVDRQL
jgi:uncharacterized protein